MVKKILLVLLIALIIIQFIRPSRNISETISTNDITKYFTVPDDVQNILKKGCYNCHSNNTEYPWYTNLQPVGWWMQNHIKEGKRELNFSEFATYAPKRQYRKLEELVKQVKEKEMPLSSYTWIHKDARLSEDERQILYKWADTLKREIAAKNNLQIEEK